MLSPRTETILKSIVGQYIARAKPVPSQSIVSAGEVRVSPATIRNEMAYLEREGYITRPHISSGSIPLDKGYRHYVDSLGDLRLPLVEQRLVTHLFHQVEKQQEEWLGLAAALIAQMVQNVAIVTLPKSKACQFKRLELISLQEAVALLILVLSGARVRRQLVALDQAMLQSGLTLMANKLSSAYYGLTAAQIPAKTRQVSPLEQQITDGVVKLMEDEDAREYEEPYLDGLHLMFNQPEFVQNHRAALALMELIEQRSLLGSILPLGRASEVTVIIGKENKVEAVHDCSLVVIQYGLPTESPGAIAVIGPTRMPYARAIAAISYLSTVLSGLVAKLYNKEIRVEQN